MTDIRKWLTLLESTEVQAPVQAPVQAEPKGRSSLSDRLRSIPDNLADDAAIQAMAIAMRGTVDRKTYQKVATDWSNALKQPNCIPNAEAAALLHISAKSSNVIMIFMALMIQRDVGMADLMPLYLKALDIASKTQIEIDHE